jgi:hypothetical protein
MRTIYWILGGVLVVLCVVGLITYGSGEAATRQAERKAQDLTQKFEDAGLTVPAKQDVFVRTLGTDGGAVCENPATALGKANLAARLVNGASFVGQRPVIVDRDVLKGEALILETYCPDVLDEYRDRIDELKTDSVLKD